MTLYVFLKKYDYFGKDRKMIEIITEMAVKKDEKTFFDSLKQVYEATEGKGLGVGFGCGCPGKLAEKVARLLGIYNSRKSAGI
jgi:hypothetical protein